MASTTITFLRLSLLLFSLILLTKAKAKLNLDISDHNSFITIQRGLGINNQHHCFRRNPCSNPGVICESRVSNLSSVLKITHIVFESEQLSGSISPAIEQLTELKELTLSNNQLFDQLPPQIVNCRKLEVLVLKNNQFSGRVPSLLSKLVRLRVLDLSSNRFSGDLSFLRYFPNLEILSLGDNMFTGKIPVSVRSFRNLRFLNISGNDNIQGRVPVLHGIEYISSETTRRNMVPKRHRLAENSTFTRPHHSPAAAPKASRTPSPAPAHSPASAVVRKHRKHKKKPVRYAIGFLAGAVAGAISGFIFSVMVRMIMACARGPGKGSGPVLFSPLIKKKEELAFLENDDGLANMEFLGSGGCGEVYKARLAGENGKLIAIKKIIQPSREAADLTEEDSKLMHKKMRQIKSEIQTVGRIRHRNLLPLLAHVPRPDCHYLVYEFMKNGSLQDILSEVSEGKKDLDWPARYRVALGIATGLEHLHVNTNPRIIHRDLKPANVLLDDDMEARIADFGLAKAMPDAHTHVTTSNIAGTVGYIAPEYHQTLKFTEKCDIYSFGVMLGVLVMGKLPSDEFFQNTREMSLVKWMRNVMTSEEPKRAIDSNLLETGDEEQMLQVLKIACFCTLDDPKQRPNSKDIRAMLIQIKQGTNPSSSGI